jgi:hypothetical protein
VNAQTELVTAPKNEHVEKIEGAITKFSAVDAGLVALREKHAGVVYAVTTTKGLEAAKAARAEVREIRYEVERVRKDAKAPLLALGKWLDREAQRVTDALLDIESGPHKQIAAEEERKEREKQERIEAERKRVADIQTRIASIASLVLETPGASIETLDGLIARADAAVADQGSFMEFQTQAAETYTSTRAKLLTARQAIVAHQAEAARLKAEREELARQRAEQAERDRLAREEAERVRAAQEAARAVQAEADAKRAAELAEREAAVAAREAAVPEQILTGPASFEMDVSAIRSFADSLDSAPLLKIEEQEPETAVEHVVLGAFPAGETEPACPGADQLIDVLSGIYRVAPETALGWLRSIDWQNVLVIVP